MVIETFDLTKRYGKKVGCEGICLSVSEGQVFGFLGPNGAGKSTLVKMLVGLIHPTGGKAHVLGKPLGSLEARRRIGFLPENFRYQDWLTGRQLLQFHCSLYGIPHSTARRRIPEVLETVGLAGREEHRIKTYSRGMQQRIGLAAALLPDPDLLFLDEPTSALDPIGRKEVRELILALKQRGKTIFLNSHLLSEVELVCDTVAIIKAGKIARIIEMAQLHMQPVLEMVLAEVTTELNTALTARGYDFSVKGNTIEVRLAEEADIPDIANTVIMNGGRLYRLNRLADSLESTFLEITGEGGGKH